MLAPIEPELGFKDVRRLAKALAQEVERRIGDQRIATTTWKVADREGVFVDFGQNARDRTIASAYSIRPTPDARASAPLRWDEVPDVEPGGFTLETMRDAGRLGRRPDRGDVVAEGQPDSAVRASGARSARTRRRRFHARKPTIARLTTIPPALAGSACARARRSRAGSAARSRSPSGTRPRAGRATGRRPRPARARRSRARRSRSARSCSRAAGAGGRSGGGRTGGAGRARPTARRGRRGGRSRCAGG